MRRTARTFELVLLASVISCARGGSVDIEPPRRVDATSEITRVLLESAEGWNRGDLDAFMLPYLRSDSTTYIGSTGLRRGFEDLREGYRTGYFRAGTPEHRLSFDDIEVRPLGRDHALAVGSYILAERGGGAEADRGIFSLVLMRTSDGWRILHDHSSSLVRR